MPGPSNTLFIEGSFSELAEELAQYIDNVQKGEEGSGVRGEVESLLATVREAEQTQEPQSIDDSNIQQTKDEILKKLVTKATSLNSAPEKEFTAAYNALISLSAQSPMREQLFARICRNLEQPVTSSATFGPSLAAAALTTIFNILPQESEARYHVFLAILRVIKSASASQAFDAMIPQLENNIADWVAAWQLDEEDARTLHETIADVAESNNNPDLAFKYNLRALETITPSSASEPEAQALARKTLIQALTNPTITDFTPLTASDSIQNLRKSDSALMELLEVFSSDDYSSYTEFLESNSLSSLNIPDTASESLSTKMRLLTLASIAASTPTRSVPYSTIAFSLQVPAEDVEMWVINTIRAGLVEGKLSQLRQEFLVQRATYRVFGEKQWAEIQGRLMVWRRSLESVLTVVRTERERFLKEGPTASFEEQQQQQGGRMNGFNEGGRGGRGGGRGGRGGRHDHQQRELDVGGD